MKNASLSMQIKCSQCSKSVVAAYELAGEWCCDKCMQEIDPDRKLAVEKAQREAWLATPYRAKLLVFTHKPNPIMEPETNDPDAVAMPSPVGSDEAQAAIATTVEDDVGSEQPEAAPEEAVEEEVKEPDTI